MALTYSVQEELGRKAPDFSLKGVDDQIYSLEKFSDKKALVLIFSCNHCPYVVATQGRINQLAKDYGPKGVGLVCVNSNDTVKYPDDSFENMKKRASEEGFQFPYLIDETQEVAKAYNAVCTPDPFVFENVGGDFLLRYHGRIDDNWKDETAVKKKDLADALDAILSGKEVHPDQSAAMGCSIKWK